MFIDRDTPSFLLENIQIEKPTFIFIFIFLELEVQIFFAYSSSINYSSFIQKPTFSCPTLNTDSIDCLYIE